MRLTVACLALLAVAASSRNGCGSESYEPCAGLACGAPCALCAPGDTDCVETAVVKACDPDGSCTAAGTFECYDPCEGKSAGDACQACPPGATRCVEPACVKACDGDGRCVCAGAAP